MRWLLSLMFLSHLLIMHREGLCAIRISSGTELYAISQEMEVFETGNSALTLSEIRHAPFSSYSTFKINPAAPVHWVRFQLVNEDSLAKELKISIAFTDRITFYQSSDGRSFEERVTGDLTPIESRDVANGKLVFVTVRLMPREQMVCYVKLESSTAISQQFRVFALNSIKGYTEEAFVERFERSRIYQSFFYGAIFIMLLFNLFIYVRIQLVSYIFYVLYLFSMILFFSSNDGYLAELFFSNYPRVDLYIRFISAPLLLCSYLLFATTFLKTSEYIPWSAKLLNGLIGMIGVSVLLMGTGNWLFGRNLVIYLVLVSFPLIMVLGWMIYKKGFVPAKYFLAGNFLLIGGALIFVIPRLFEVQQNPFLQYSLQIAALLEVAFFSIALADRFRTVQNELAEVIIENEVQKRLVETERKKIIEEKNKELEKLNQELNMYIYKTAHDIKGPIARLRGLCKVGLLELRDPVAVDYLKKLEYNSNYLNYIINRLAIVYDVNNIQITLEKIQWDKIRQTVLFHLNTFDAFKEVNLRISIPDELKFTSDYRLLEQILINLMENAVRFQDKEKSRHEIALLISGSMEGIRIEVTDNGIGIPSEDVSGLFEMFSKAAAKHHNVGLGLYICKLCTDKLKGSIECESEEGKYARFIVSLPGISEATNSVN